MARITKVDLERLSRQDIVIFLDAIPNIIQGPISLNNLLRDRNLVNGATISSTLVFLKFFNVISTRTRGADVILTIPSIHAFHFIKSLTLYLRNKLSLIASWDDVIKSGEIFVDEFLNWGNQFLFAMERNRVSNLRSSKPIADVQILQLIVKLNVTGSDKPYFLLRYNLKRLSLQLLGGYIEPDDLNETEAAYRLLRQELQFNEIERDEVEFHKAFPTIVTKTTSVENGVYTSFMIQPYFVHFKKNELKLDRLFQLVTLDEIKESITKTNIPIRFPTYDMPRNKQQDFYQMLEKLSVSLAKPQQVTSNADFKTQNTFYSKLPPLTNKILEDEESEHLEFKSSARWDYQRNIFNKELEIPIIKTIAAFLNSDGGTLLIGVSDYKDVLGISKDIDTLQHKGVDSYTQFLTNMIKTYIGLEYASLVDIQYVTFDARNVCVVKVKRSVQPVFIKRHENSEFYVRAGNTSRLLNSEETYKYIRTSWQ